jgi:hypothetical protein
VDPESPLSIGLQTAPWPPKFKPVFLLKYNGFGNSMQFLMRYESAVNSAGGDDVALDKSFIVACEGPVLNWYSLLQPHSVCSWVDLKTKFIQAFQIFHETTVESSDLYKCKQKGREPLRNFVRRFMQQSVNTKKWYRRKADLWAELGDEYHSAGKNLLKGIGKGRLRSAVCHRSAKGLFALLKGKFAGMHGDVARCRERTS